MDKWNFNTEIPVDQGQKLHYTCLDTSYNMEYAMINSFNSSYPTFKLSQCLSSPPPPPPRKKGRGLDLIAQFDLVRGPWILTLQLQQTFGGLNFPAPSQISVWDEERGRQLEFWDFKAQLVQIKHSVLSNNLPLIVIDFILKMKDF